jgi:colicin import membrane protein
VPKAAVQAYLNSSSWKQKALKRQKQEELEALERQEKEELEALDRQKQEEMEAMEDSERSTNEWRAILNSIAHSRDSILVELKAALDLAATFEDAKKAAEQEAKKAAEEARDILLVELKNALDLAATFEEAKKATEQEAKQAAEEAKQKCDRAERSLKQTQTRSLKQRPRRFDRVGLVPLH